MKEVLFRGKRVDNHEWVYGYYVELKYDGGKLGKCGFIYPSTEADYISVAVDPKTIGQYTGLTANGNKIFEGDILDYFDTLYIVSWSDNLLTYIVTSVDEKKEYLFYINKANMDCVYIVGNIHDNPELLEVKL